MSLIGRGVSVLLRDRRAPRRSHADGVAGHCLAPDVSPAAGSRTIGTAGRHRMAFSLYCWQILGGNRGAIRRKHAHPIRRRGQPRHVSDPATPRRRNHTRRIRLSRRDRHRLTPVNRQTTNDYHRRHTSHQREPQQNENESQRRTMARFRPGPSPSKMTAPRWRNPTRAARRSRRHPTRPARRPRHGSARTTRLTGRRPWSWRGHKHPCATTAQPNTQQTTVDIATPRNRGQENPDRTKQEQSVRDRDTSMGKHGAWISH